MGTRFACVLVPAALTLGLAACDDSRASSQTLAPGDAAPTVPAQATAGTDPVHYVRSASEPFPRSGYCSAGACAWLEAREQQVVGSSQHERLVRVTLAGGRSIHADNDFPDYAAGIAVHWTGEIEEAYAFCSRWRPMVMRRQGGGGWQQVRVDLVRGTGDFEESSRALFGLVCHPGEDWTEEGFFARRGSRPQDGDAVTGISHPQTVPFIHPNDPERPELGGMAVSHSAPPEIVSVPLASPPPTIIEARPPPEKSGPTELVVANARGEILRDLGTYPSLAACERARAIRGRDHPGAICSVGERSRIH